MLRLVAFVIRGYGYSRSYWRKRKKPHFHFLPIVSGRGGGGGQKRDLLNFLSFLIDPRELSDSKVYRSLSILPQLCPSMRGFQEGRKKKKREKRGGEGAPSEPVCRRDFVSK